MADSATPDNDSKMSSKSSEKLTTRSVKERGVTKTPPSSYGRSSARKGIAYTPEMSGRESSYAMDFDEYKPSLADKLRIGYFSQDRACQTESSDIIQIHNMVDVMRHLVTDLDTMKRNIHYAKYIQRAEYENQLQERALDLYCRVNERLLEMEKDQAKRVEVMRRCFRQQLGDAISEVANRHKSHYQNKRKEENAKMAEKLDKAKGDDDELKKAQQQQQTMLDMMRMQMREAQERADAQLQEALDRRPSPSSVATDPEIYELREEVENLEKKLDDALNEMEAKDNENRKLASEMDMLNDQLQEEKEQVMKLKKELSDALLGAEQERNKLRSEMERQRAALQNEMESRLHNVRQNSPKASFVSANAVNKPSLAFMLNEKNMLAESQKEVEKLKKLHDQQSKERDLLEKQRLDAMSKVEQKEEISESEKDELLKRLQKIEKKQRQEISRLQKELDRANKTWEMKVTILQQTMHALRDESFLRTSLQRQSAKLQHAAVVYASTGPAVIPLSTPHRPSKTLRTLPAIRPGRVEGFGRILEGKRIGAESAMYSEDRASPVPQDPDHDGPYQGSDNQPSESISMPPEEELRRSCFTANNTDHEKQLNQVAVPATV